MQIPGEAFFLMNGWMDYLCLVLAARMGRRRLRLRRGLAGALAGAVYSLGALYLGPWARSWPALAGMALVMGRIAFGRDFPWGGVWIFGAGLGLHGCMDFLTARGLDAGAGLGLCSLLGLGLALVTGRLWPRDGGEYGVMIRWQGRRLRLRGIRDSGNLLRDGVTGLPVMVAPRETAQALLAGPWDGGLSRLPRGMRLIPAETAAGRCLCPCLHPDMVILTRAGRRWQTDALLAFAEIGEGRALLPEALFMERKEEYHASL